MIDSGVCADPTPEVESYLRLLGSVVPHNGAVYAAAPITTGARFLQWYAERGAQAVEADAYAEEHRLAVVQPNCEDAAIRIAQIRKTLHLPVIDPSAFDRRGWSQEEYREFWTAVIRRYAAMVVFLDGWQYSSGCNFEFHAAMTADIPTLKENMEPLSRTAGCELIHEAASEFRRHGLSATVLESVLRSLNSETFEQGRKAKE